MPSPTARPGAPAGIDPRGPRVGAGLTALLLVVVLLLTALESVWPSVVVLALVVVSFAIGTARGPQGTWQGAFFKRFVRPRLSPPTDLEDPRPPTFAQLVGLIITGVGLVLGLLAASGLVPGLAVAVTVSAALALVAAFLNSVFGLCLGCEMYLLGQRLRARA